MSSQQKKKTNTGEKNASSQAAAPAQQAKPKTQTQPQGKQQAKQQGQGQGQGQGKQQQKGGQQQGKQGQQGKQQQTKQAKANAPKNVDTEKGKGAQQQQPKKQGGKGQQQGQGKQQGKQQQQQGKQGKQGGQGQGQGQQQKKKAATQVKSAKTTQGAGGAKKKKATQGKPKSASAKKGSSKKKQTQQQRGSSKKKKGGSKKKTTTKGRTAGGKKGSGKKKKTADGKTKSKFRLRNSRQQGRQTGNSKLWDKLRPTEDDVLKMLAAQVHVGPARCHANMQRYVFKRRKDGLHVINLDKTWHKMVLAARILAAVQNPADIMVMSTRTYGQRGAIKFAQYIGATPMVGKWIPGTFCNPQNKAYAEPRLLLVDDPATCFAALRETSYVGIPVVALAGINNNSRFVDCAIPCNNRGKFSLGLLFWLLAREILRIKNEIPRTKPWDVAVDLFFYRDPDKIKKAQEEKARKQEQQEYGAQTTEYYEPQYGATDTYQPTGDFGIENLQSSWEQEPPQQVLEDWAAADVMMDAPYQGYSGGELEAGHPYQPQEQYDEPQYYTTEEQAFGTVHMQQW